jgi:MtaA/CmuA family methyltransferase
MSGKELIMKAFNLEPIERIPWVPFVGVHAASLIGVDAETYLKSDDLIVKGISKAIELYKPDGIPVVFDLQLEAECLGCSLLWAEDNPPSVSSHPLNDQIDPSNLLIPGMNDGRIATVMSATRRLRATFPDIALYGLITGPFTLALHLLGTEVFMQMFTNKDYLHKLMKYCNRVCKSMTTYYKEAGCDIIAVVDPMTSQVSPDQFKEFISEYETELFDFIKLSGAFSSFFVCGHAKHNIQVMCDCQPDNISIDENIPLDYVRDICTTMGISFGGNLQLTATLLMGTPEECEWDALKCMDLGGNKGFILAPGCDLAYATPTENLKAVTELVFDTYRQDIVRTMEAKKIDVALIDKTVYSSSDKVIIDVITLDSSSCAPCQYMLEAAKRACEEFGDKVTLNERSIKTREGLEFLTAIGAKNIPTLCIDGEVTFVSNIPPVNEIKKVIESKINKKV